MRFQLISIFPEFFDVLRISLVGKAAQNGILSWIATDLRDFTDDPHRTVDDTPYGGGAGMVMRADIWGKAIDRALENCDLDAGESAGRAPEDPENPEVTGQSAPPEAQSPRRAKTVLAVPTPSGHPLTQAKVRELAEAKNIIVACGRYEGIDARVVAHYREVPNVEVFEYSLGDYVLNGGEIAAVALVEAVGRLLEGMVGNPESLVEESFEGSGLLEYPSYTRPSQWRNLEVPEVLLGGNHAKIEEWRRTQALGRTARMRPELLEHLDAAKLSKTEREILAGWGWIYLPSLVPGDSAAAVSGHNATRQTKVAGGANGAAPCSCVAQRVVIRKPKRGEALALSALGSETFPLACPSYITPAEIEEFTEVEFNLETVKARLKDPEHHRYLVAEIGGELVGYTYVIVGLDEAEAQRAGITPGDAYLSKCYVRESLRGLGLSGALLEAALAELDSTMAVSLGTSIYNKRAQKFYRRHGFKKIGAREFVVGGRVNQDVVMRRLCPDSVGTS